MIREFEQDTIAAISTPPGEGGIGIVRLSGRQALAIADKIFSPRGKTPAHQQKSFTAQYGHVVASEGGRTRVVDEVLLLVMRAPKSYTCEDVVEISAHGGAATLEAILRLVLEAGARLAAPGEFTQRAFLNGRIDLLQAEAVLDLIQAKTELGQRAAAAHLGGGLSKKMLVLKDVLVGVLSHLEACVDFPEDAPDTDSREAIEKKIEGAVSDIHALLAGSELGLIVKNGLKTVIAGRPNVGKSSLMNRLSRSDRVIVTAYPGTTRDVVEETVQMRGLPLRLLDTAGIQDSSHPIEKQGIERSKKSMEAADLVLYVLDGSQNLSPEDTVLLKSLNDKAKIVVINKMDLKQNLEVKELQQYLDGSPLAYCSCLDDRGIDELENKIFSFICQGRELSHEPLVSSLRQKTLLQKTLESLEQAQSACREHLSPEFCAADVRIALQHLGELVGEVVPDDVLEVLFKQFCIGK